MKRIQHTDAGSEMQKPMCNDRSGQLRAALSRQLSQSYNHKELNAANSMNQTRRGFFPELPYASPEVGTIFIIEIQLTYNIM